MSLADADNTQVIADLQRRRFTLALIFYGGLAAIPLGVICPCGAAAVVYRFAPDWSQSVALSAFLLPLVGLAAALLMLGDRSRAKRSLALAQMSDALGLRLTLQPSRDRFDFLEHFRFLHEFRMANSGSGANLLEGFYKGRPLAAVDYSALYHVLQLRPFVRAQTVAVFTRGFEALPAFAIVSLTMADRFDKAIFGDQSDEVKVPGEKEFNRRFAVQGKNHAAILKCLTPEIIDLLLEDNRTTVEVHEGMLLVAYRRTVVSAEEYAEFLKRANWIAKELEKA